MRSNEPFEGIHRPIKWKQPRFLNRKGKKEGIHRKGLDMHMRDRYAKSRGDPDQWRGFKVYERNIPRTNRGISRMRKCWQGCRALIEREQAVGLKKWSIAATNHTTGGGGSLSDWDEPGKRLENDTPTWWKSYKTRPCIWRQNIAGWSILELLYPSWKFLRMFQLLIFWKESLKWKVNIIIFKKNIFLIIFFFFFWKY